MKQYLIVILLAMTGVVAQAGDREERAALRTQFDSSFARGDFKALDARYRAAVQKKERTSSGVFVSHELVSLVYTRGREAQDESPGQGAYWAPVEQIAQKWLAQEPTSLYAALVLAEAHIGHAWSWRGGGFARSVTKENWTRFGEELAKARDILESRRLQGEQDPNWHWQMLRLERMAGKSATRYRDMANAALDRFPGHYNLYFEIAQQLTPRWGGSYEALAEFAEFATARTKAEEGQSLYARIYWSAYGGMDPGGFERKEVDWKKVRAGFEDVVKRYPDPRNINFYARMACDAADKPTARKLVDRIGTDVVTDVWSDRAQWVRCRSWAQS